MAFIIVAIVAFIVGSLFPMGVKIVIFIADCFLPDPFPFADELGLIVAIAKGIGNR